MLHQTRVLQQLLMSPKDLTLRRTCCVIAQALQLNGRTVQRVLQRRMLALCLAGLFDHLQRALCHVHHIPIRRTRGGAHPAQHIRHLIIGDGLWVRSQHHALNLFAASLCQQLGQLTDGRVGIRPRSTEVNAVCIRGLQRHDRYQRLGVGAVVLAMQLNTRSKTFCSLSQNRSRTRMQAVGVGQQHGLRMQHWTIFMAGGRRLRPCFHVHVQHRLTGLDLHPAVRQRLNRFAADDQHQRQQTARMKRQVIGIKLDQRLPGLNTLAVFHLRDETFALKVHRVQANVQQHLHAAVMGDAQGMPGVLHVSDDARQRGAQHLRRWIDAHAVAHQATGKHRVGDIIKCTHDSRQGRQQFQL